MKKLLYFLSILIIASMILSACETATTEPPTVEADRSRRPEIEPETEARSSG